MCKTRGIRFSQEIPTADALHGHMLYEEGSTSQLYQSKHGALSESESYISLPSVCASGWRYF